MDRARILGEIDRFLDEYDPEGSRLAPGARMPDPGRLVNAIGEPVKRRGPPDPARFFGDMTAYKTIEDVAKRSRRSYSAGGQKPT